VHHNTLYFAYTWSFMISWKKSFSNKLNRLGECNNNKRRILLHINSKCFSRVDCLDFWCSQCVPTKLPSSFQYVHIKFPLCPNTFLICSLSSQDVPNSTTHFIPWPLPKVELSLLYFCSKIANFYLRSTVWHTPGLFNNLNQELSSMKWHFALMK